MTPKYVSTIQSSHPNINIFSVRGLLSAEHLSHSQDEASVLSKPLHVSGSSSPPPGAHTKTWGSLLTLLLLSYCISNLVRRSHWFILQKISKSDCFSPPVWPQPWSKPTSFFTLNTTNSFLIGSFPFTYHFSLRVHSHQEKQRYPFKVKS